MRSNRARPRTQRLATRIAAVAMLPAGVIAATPSIAAAVTPPPPPPTSTQQAEALVRLDRLLVAPETVTVADVEWFLTGGQGFTADELVRLVDRLAADADPGSPFGALARRLADSTAEQLTSLFDHLRPMTAHDVQEVADAVATLDIAHVQVLLARVGGLAPGDLDAFVATVADLGIADADLAAFFAFVSA